MMKGFCITINQQLLPCALKGLKFFPADEKWGPGIFFQYLENAKRPSTP